MRIRLKFRALGGSSQFGLTHSLSHRLSAAITDFLITLILRRVCTNIRAHTHITNERKYSDLAALFYRNGLALTIYFARLFLAIFSYRRAKLNCVCE